MNTKQTNFENVGELYAQIIENPETDEKTANEIWKHIRKTIEDTDLTNPDTIRRLYPIAAQIVAEDENFRREFWKKRQSELSNF